MFMYFVLVLTLCICAISIRKTCKMSNPVHFCNLFTILYFCLRFVRSLINAIKFVEKSHSVSIWRWNGYNMMKIITVMIMKLMMTFLIMMMVTTMMMMIIIKHNSLHMVKFSIRQAIKALKTGKLIKHVQVHHWSGAWCSVREKTSSSS